MVTHAQATTVSSITPLLVDVSQLSHTLFIDLFNILTLRFAFAQYRCMHWTLKFNWSSISNFDHHEERFSSGIGNREFAKAFDT
jgi:hypothetical protein